MSEPAPEAEVRKIHVSVAEIMLLRKIEIEEEFNGWNPKNVFHMMTKKKMSNSLLKYVLLAFLDANL